MSARAAELLVRFERVTGAVRRCRTESLSESIRRVADEVHHLWTLIEEFESVGEKRGDLQRAACALLDAYCELPESTQALLEDAIDPPHASASSTRRPPEGSGI